MFLWFCVRFLDCRGVDTPSLRRDWLHRCGRTQGGIAWTGGRARMGRGRARRSLAVAGQADPPGRTRNPPASRRPLMPPPRSSVAPASPAPSSPRLATGGFLSPGRRCTHRAASAGLHPPAGPRPSAAGSCYTAGETQPDTAGHATDCHRDASTLLRS